MRSYSIFKNEKYQNLYIFIIEGKIGMSVLGESLCTLYYFENFTAVCKNK